jgi:PIN domain nuclease of toxin-antitoxin system
VGERLLIILDTHIFIWLIEESVKRIPKSILSAIENEPVLGIPAISLWEVAMLENKGRIVLSMPLLPWLQEALTAPKMKLLPISPEVAARSASLLMHGDPADRLIAATAIEHDCFLATLDDSLRLVPLLKTIAIP